MPRSGPRPHVWKVPGEIPHQQYLAYLQCRAQANYRAESFLLSFADYQQLWQGLWHRKGRGTDSYCLVRIDPEGAWTVSNCECIPRIDHLRRQRLYKKLDNEEKRNGKTWLRSKI